MYAQEIAVMNNPTTDVYLSGSKFLYKQSGKMPKRLITRMEDSRRRAKIESGIKPDALFMQKSPIMVTYPTQLKRVWKNRTTSTVFSVFWPMADRQSSRKVFA
mmetsp:Transcript_224/g.616  ORF Transcript_224/g.616 Transcript_224/m.616 type:complete len:103 (-) Transcript_224:273-581(-)